MGLAFHPFTGFHRLLHSPFISSWVFTVFCIRLSSLCGRRCFLGCLYACRYIHLLSLHGFSPSFAFAFRRFVDDAASSVVCTLVQAPLAARPWGLLFIPSRVFTVFYIHLLSL